MYIRIYISINYVFFSPIDCVWVSEVSLFLWPDIGHGSTSPHSQYGMAIIMFYRYVQCMYMYVYTTYII